MPVLTCVQFNHWARRSLWRYDMVACDHLKHQLPLVVKLFHLTVSTKRDYLTACRIYLQRCLHAFNSTEDWTAQLRREMWLKIVTKWSDNEKWSLSIFDHDWRCLMNRIDWLIKGFLFKRKEVVCWCYRLHPCKTRLLASVSSFRQLSSPISSYLTRRRLQHALSW